MKIKSIKKLGKQNVYDISVKDAEQYVLENGVVTHNTGLYYSADQIYIIGKSQSKGTTSATSKDLLGYNFTLRVEKSRFIKENSKIPITVHYEHKDSKGNEYSGILPYSGLVDIAKAYGIIENCRVGRAGGYKLVIDNAEALGIEEDIMTLTGDVLVDSDFWEKVFKYTNLKEVVEAVYRIPTNVSKQEEELLDNVNTELLDLVDGSADE